MSFNQNSPGLAHLPSQILAPQRISDLLARPGSSGGTRASFSDDSMPKRPASTPGPSTRPPIVWFPGEPDCNETPTSNFKDTFQLIAFLLSVFNIAAAMVANANNNNNNNNINDNKLNGNENNINEGNANSEIMSMNMIMRSIAVEEGRSIKTKRSTGRIASSVMEFMSLWLKLLVTNSKDCQRLHFCEANESTSKKSLIDWNISEVLSLRTAQLVAKSAQNDLKDLLLAGQYGRIGLNCSELYKDCNANELRFTEFAQLMAWSPVGELKHMRSLVSWMLTK